MTIVNVNGISGINSITAQSNTLNFYTAAGSNLPISAETLNVGTGASVSSPASNILALGTNNTEAIRIGPNGNVGIGTTNNNTAIKLRIFQSESLSYNPAFLVNIGGPNGGYLEWQTDGTTIGDIGSAYQLFGSPRGDGNHFAINARPNRPLILGTNNTERLRINSSGNVGVGTTNPLQPMDIVANNDGAYAQYFRMRYNYNDYSFIGFRSSNGSEDIAQIGAYRSSASNGGLLFYTNNGSATGSERVRVSAAGTMTLRASGGAFIEGYNADDNQLSVAKLSRMGYATSYRNLVIGKHLPNSTITYQSISLNYDPSTNVSGNFTGAGNEIFVPNNNQGVAYYTSILQPNTTNDGFNALVRFGPSGQVLTPNQPRFFAKCNSSSYSTTSPIQFTSVDVNIGSGYDSSTYRFTAPIAGTYYFVSTAYINAGNTVNDGGYIRFRINGSAVQYAYAGPGNSASPNGHITVTLTKMISLSANDWVDVTFSVIGNGSYFAGVHETTFGGYLMG